LNFYFTIGHFFDF